MQINRLRYFLEIAKTGSFSRAAQNLYLSQPSLTQQMHKLEETLGIQLLLRHPRSIELTDAGEQFFIHAERIVNDFDRLTDLMDKYSRLEAGTLKLGMPYISGYLGLFEMLKRYRDKTPGIQFTLTTKGTSTLISRLKKGDLHAAFVIGGEEHFEHDEDLFCQKVIKDEYMALVPALHPLAAKPLITLEDLAEETLVMPSKESIFSRQIGMAFEEKGISIHTLIETSQTNIVEHLVAAGLGIGFASSAIAKKLADENISAVPLEKTMHRTVFYTARFDLLDYPTVADFTAFTREYYRV